MNRKPGFVIVLATDAQGPMYLGRTDCGRQGVRRLENAIVYVTCSRAHLVASDYPGAVVANAR